MTSELFFSGSLWAELLLNLKIRETRAFVPQLLEEVVPGNLKTGGSFIMRSLERPQFLLQEGFCLSRYQGGGTPWMMLTKAPRKS